VIYDDVCVRNSPNPITLDTAYSAAGTLKGTSMPEMREVLLHNVRVSGGGKITFNGYDKSHRIAAQLDDVQLTDSLNYRVILNHSDLKLGPGAVNIAFPTGDDSSVSGKPSSGKAASCSEKFVPFPSGESF